MKGTLAFQAELNNDANNFVVALYDSADNLLETKAPNKPYGNPFSVMFDYNLVPQLVYKIKLWESVDTSPSGQVRCSGNLNADSTTTTLRATDYLETDVSPGLVSGTGTYVDATMVGWTYHVERVGQGTLYPQTAPSPTYAQDDSGGFHLVLDGDTFQPNERFVIFYDPQVANNATPGDPSGPYSSGNIITISRAIISSDYNKALFLQGATPVITETLPALSAVADFTFLYFYSAGGSHVTANIVCSGTDKIQRSVQVGLVRLCQNESLKIFKSNGVWNIDYISPSVDMVGEIVYLPIGSATGRNLLPLVGGTPNATTYARLADFIAANPSNTVAQSVWANTTTKDGRIYYINKGFFGSGAGGNIQLMDYSGMFLRIADNYSNVGLSKWDTVMDHSHDSYAGRLSGDPMGYVPGNKLHGQFNSSFNGPTDLTGNMYNKPGAGNPATAIQRIDTETSPVFRFIGAYIRI